MKHTVQGGGPRGRGARAPARRPGPRPIARPPNHVAAELRSPAAFGPRVRAPGDWLERQADDAARAMRDRSSAHVSLSSIAPAPAPPLGSGAPLPDALRAGLERGFAAALGGVRVHDGGAAAQLARALGARAFVAGRHVVVGAGESSRAGYPELLAHEVAHVLQQAGRRGADGTLHVADVTGTGAIQRAPIVLATSTPIPSLDDIATRHLAGDASVEPDLQGYIQRVQADLTARGEAAVIDELAAEAIAPAPVSPALGARDAISALSWKHKSYVFDLLKRAGRYPAAIALFHGQDLRTTFYSNELYQALAVAHPEEVNPGNRWLGLHVFDHFGPQDFALAVLQYFVGVTRPIQAVVDLESTLAALEATRNGAAGLLVVGTGAGAVSGHERVFATIAAVRRFHAWHAEKLAALAHDVTTSSTDPSTLTPEQRREVARRFQAWAEAVDADRTQIPSREPDEVRALIGIMAHPFAVIARFAITDVLDPILGAATQPAADRLRGQRDQLRGGAALRELTTFRTDYTPRFRALFALDPDGNIPSITTFSAAHRALSDGLLGYLRRNFELRGYAVLRSFLETTAAHGRYTGPSPAPYLLMARQLDELRRLLAGYDAAADRAFEGALAGYRPTDGAGAGPVPEPGVPDHRVRHRMVIARWLGELATTLAWSDLAQLADAVVTSRQTASGGAGLAHSYLALLGEWHESSDQRIARITEDFAPGTEVRGLAPLTMSDFATFYRMLYDEDLASARAGSSPRIAPRGAWARPRSCRARSRRPRASSSGPGATNTRGRSSTRSGPASRTRSARWCSTTRRPAGSSSTIAWARRATPRCARSRSPIHRSSGRSHRSSAW
jgi:uncharacterized protein DUF4157